MRVGLFGWFKRGNFGDDLMAVLISNHLLSAGHQVTCWGLSSGNTHFAGCYRTDDIKRLVSWSDLLVYAGGGLFTQGHANVEHKENFKDIENSFIREIKSQKKPLALISVGGDGSNTMLSPCQLKIASLASYVSLRNAEDLEWFRGLGFEQVITVIPDIVWTIASNPFKIEDLGESQRNFNIYLHNVPFRFAALLRRAAELVNSISFGFARIKICIIFTESYPESLYEGAPCPCIPYRTVHQMLSSLDACSLLVTNRLHLAMTALANKKSVISFRPEVKAFLVFSSLGSVVPIVRTYAGLLLAIFAASLSGILSIFKYSIKEESLDSLSRRASSHFQFLSEFLASHESSHKG